MQILLDSNVWRYLVDQDAEEILEQCVSELGLDIAVAPVLVSEARGLLDDHVRKRLLRLLTRPGWTRLMPEAFLEAEEIKTIIRKYRKEWMFHDPNLIEVAALESDWKRSIGGFWSRSHDDEPIPVSDQSLRAQMEHRLARDESLAIRKGVLSRKEILPEISLRQAYCRPPEGLPGSLGEPVEYWRVPSLYHLQAELSVYASPYREWLDSEIDIVAIGASQASLTQLWYYEITPNDAPRQWLRGAFEFLQAFHKTTPGTPVDSQLSSHLIDVDIMVSADRNFVRFAEKCRSDAPFSLARTLLVTGGAASIPQLIELLRTLRQ